MILAALLLQTLTIDEARLLSPAVAGDLILTRRDHRPIETVLAPPRGSLQPPNVEELQLVERADRIARGCLRRRWTASFRRPADGEPALLDRSHDATEIAMARSDRCAAALFVHVNPGLEPTAALDALHQLDRLRTGRTKAIFTCEDDTPSRLCADPAALPRILGTLTPWAVSRRAGEMVFWLGTSGGIVTEVRFAPTTPGRVAIARRIPAPA